MRFLNIPLKLIAIGLIRFYQDFISPMLGPKCRFMPTCSEYSLQALRKYGFLKGSVLTLKRVLKCHPFSRKYGVDELE
jgi:uncharacterized protein